MNSLKAETPEKIKFFFKQKWIKTLFNRLFEARTIQEEENFN